MFHNDDIIYLPKDNVVTFTKENSVEENVSLNINQPIESHGDIVLPSAILEYFINEANFHFIMDWCICRSASSCENYPINLGCLFLGEAAMKIDPKLGRKVTKEEAHEHVKNCRQAGLVHLIGRNKLDTVWLKVGPGEKLLTVCNCCNCCCLWRILPHVSSKISSKVTKMPGVTVSVNDNCTGCGKCINVCFVKSIEIIDKKANIGEMCKGCGRCTDFCPKSAIEVSIDGFEKLNRVTERIESLVDVT